MMVLDATEIEAAMHAVTRVPSHYFRGMNVNAVPTAVFCYMRIS